MKNINSEFNLYRHLVENKVFTNHIYWIFRKNLEGVVFKTQKGKVIEIRNVKSVKDTFVTFGGYSYAITPKINKLFLENAKKDSEFLLLLDKIRLAFNECELANAAILAHKYIVHSNDKLSDEVDKLHNKVACLYSAKVLHYISRDKLMRDIYSDAICKYITKEVEYFNRHAASTLLRRYRKFNVNSPNQMKILAKILIVAFWVLLICGKFVAALICAVVATILNFEK